MALEERRIWVDGKLVPWAEVTVHVLAQSPQRGSLVFDVMPAYWRGDRPLVLGLREHVDRFRRSAELNGMRLATDRDDLLRAIGQTLRANPGAEIVKISGYHAGISLDVLPTTRVPTVAIAAFAIRDVAPAWRGREGPPARLQLAASIKMPSRVISPQLKIAAGYTHAAIAKQIARDAGFDDVLFLDEQRHVTESSTQSFFLVESGVVRTAPTESVLAGITRTVVIELVRDEGMPLKEEPIEEAALARASEAFLAGTTTNVWPVGRIDGRDLPEPVPGPLTERLARRFARLVAGEDPEFSARWLQEA
jgi:branched-chain amino acid aminotransferase